MNNTISELTMDFLIQHHKRSPYHPQENGTIKSFNNILETLLTKFCYVEKDDWDVQILVVLWDYMTTTKKIHENN